MGDTLLVFNRNGSRSGKRDYRLMAASSLADEARHVTVWRHVGPRGRDPRPGGMERRLKGQRRAGG